MEGFGWGTALMAVCLLVAGGVFVYAGLYRGKTTVKRFATPKKSKEIK